MQDASSARAISTLDEFINVEKLDAATARTVNDKTFPAGSRVNISTDERHSVRFYLIVTYYFVIQRNKIYTRIYIYVYALCTRRVSR